MIRLEIEDEGQELVIRVDVPTFVAWLAARQAYQRTAGADPLATYLRIENGWNRELEDDPIRIALLEYAQSLDREGEG